MIRPSVSTPSQSRISSLILRARSVAVSGSSINGCSGSASCQLADDVLRRASKSARTQLALRKQLRELFETLDQCVGLRFAQLLTRSEPVSNGAGESAGAFTCNHVVLAIADHNSLRCRAAELPQRFKHRAGVRF